MRIYQVRIEGHLEPHWAAWFDELTITHEADGHTALTSALADQAALHGVLAKVRDLGLTLVAVTTLDPGCGGDHGQPPRPASGRAPPAATGGAGRGPGHRGGALDVEP